MNAILCSETLSNSVNINKMLRHICQHLLPFFICTTCLEFLAIFGLSPIKCICCSKLQTRCNWFKAIVYVKRVTCKRTHKL